jgi:hypothetical protein
MENNVRTVRIYKKTPLVEVPEAPHYIAQGMDFVQMEVMIPITWEMVHMTLIRTLN